MLKEIVIYKPDLGDKKYLLVFNVMKKLIFFSIIDAVYPIESIFNLKVININYQNKTGFLGVNDGEYFVNFYENKIQLGSNLVCQLSWYGNNEKQPKVKIGFNLIGRYVVVSNNKMNKYSCNINSVIQDYVNINKITGIVFRSIIDDLNDYTLLFSELEQLIKIRDLLNNNQSHKIGLLYKAPSIFIQFIREQNDLMQFRINTNDFDSYNELMPYQKLWGIGDIQYIKDLVIDISEYYRELNNDCYIYHDIRVKFNKLSGINLIDIDNMNAKVSFYQSNLIVLDLIVEQIILKDLTGIILIDLIKNMTVEQKNYIVDKIKSLFFDDFRKVKIFGFTGSEMFELIRLK